MDKLKAIETFIAIADEGSLTRAAAALSTSTPTVTRMLAALESSLRVRLFTRTTRRIVLTDEGRAYLERARHVVAAVDIADAAVADRGDDVAGRVVVTAPVLFGQLVVAPIVMAFLKKNPRASAQLLLFDRMVNMVEEGVDVGVRIGALNDSTLVASMVGRVRRVVVASPAYLKKHGTPQTPRDLLQHNCFGFSASPVPWWTFQEGKRVVPVPVSGNIDFSHAAPAVDACVAGAGIGMFVSYQVGPLLFARPQRLVVLLEKFEVPPRPISVVVPGNRLLPRRTRAMLDALKAGLTALKSPFAPPSPRVS